MGFISLKKYFYEAILQALLLQRSIECLMVPNT